MSSKDISEKIVVVLGASSGYGLAASRELLKSGATVVMAARHDNHAELARLCEQNPRGHVAACDVRDAVAVHALADEIVEQFGRIDAWVNSASVGAVGHFTKANFKMQLDVINTDLIGTLHGSLAAIEQFRAQATGGVLINVSADPDALNLPYMATFAAAKMGVVGFSRSLQAEAKAEKWKDIHICIVMPSDFSKREASEVPDTGTETKPPKVQAAVLDDVADAIVSLVVNPKDVVTVHGTHYFL